MSRDIAVNIIAVAVPAVGKAADLNGVAVYPQGGLGIEGPRFLPTERGEMRDHVFIHVSGVTIKCIIDTGLNAATFVTNLIARFDANLP